MTTAPTHRLADCIVWHEVGRHSSSHLAENIAPGHYVLACSGDYVINGGGGSWIKAAPGETTPTCEACLRAETSIERTGDLHWDGAGEDGVEATPEGPTQPEAPTIDLEAVLAQEVHRAAQAATQGAPRRTVAEVQEDLVERWGISRQAARSIALRSVLAFVKVRSALKLGEPPKI